MFIQDSELFIQPYSEINKYKKRYEILTNHQPIGEINDMKGSRSNFFHLIKIFFHFPYNSQLNLQITNNEGEIAGYIRRESSFLKMKDFYIFNSKKELIATIKTESKLTSIKLTVLQDNDETYFLDEKLSAMDFSLIDNKTGETITIRQRSPIYETIEENIKKGIDGYYVKTANKFEETIIRIACIVAIHSQSIK